VLPKAIIAKAIVLTLLDIAESIFMVMHICAQVPPTLKMIKDVDMDQDELSAALRNQGLIRQARYADRDGTTAKDTIKRMRKAGSSGTAQFTCHARLCNLQFAVFAMTVQYIWHVQSWPVATNKNQQAQPWLMLPNVNRRPPRSWSASRSKSGVRLITSDACQAH